MSKITSVHYFMLISFVIGYFFITIEHITKINKSLVALLMAVVCWIFQFADPAIPLAEQLKTLHEHLGSVSQIIFFLLGALCIVEMMNVHGAFYILSKSLHIRSKRGLIWLVGILAFFLSSVLDNLTTTIIMISLLKKIVDEGEERLLFGGAVVVAANAGGAWTPIGDVTTTMLWIGGQLSTFSMVKTLFIPSIICLIAFLGCLTPFLKGDFSLHATSDDEKKEPLSTTIFCVGMASLLFVPVFKVMTGLPPFMGMLLGLGVLWLITDLAYRNKPQRQYLRMPAVFASIDLSGVLFFLGILLCIDALQAGGLLRMLATGLNQWLVQADLIAIAIGLASAIVDNVPLVAAIMGMYPLDQYPLDSNFWNLIAYCAGTGGSILVIGSAAGIAYMGLEKVQFFWYLRRVGLAAGIGYFAGIGIFKLMQLA